MKTCVIKECTNKSIKRGMCITHWLALNTRRTENGCLEWTGKINDKGYPRLVIGKKRRDGRKAIFLTFDEKITDSSHNIHHTCGNKKCVEITHLRSSNPFQSKV